MGLVRFGTGLMKNPHPDKKFFHFFEKILNGQAEDLSLSSSTESVCSEYRAVCLEFFRGNFLGDLWAVGGQNVQTRMLLRQIRRAS